MNLQEEAAKIMDDATKGSPRSYGQQQPETSSTGTTHSNC